MILDSLIGCFIGSGRSQGERLYEEFYEVYRESGKTAAYEYAIRQAEGKDLEALECFLEKLNGGPLPEEGVSSIGLGKMILGRLLTAEEGGTLVKLLRWLHEGGFFRGSDAKEYGKGVGNVGDVSFCWNVAVKGTKPTKSHDVHRRQLEIISAPQQKMMEPIHQDIGLKRRHKGRE